MLSDDFENPSNIEKYMLKTEYKNLDIIISDYQMATIELDLLIKSYRESLLKTLFNPLLEKGIYDYIIFDCNPMLGLLNQNILSVTDYIIIPVELSPFGVSGLNVLFKFISQSKKINPNLDILGILRNKVDRRYSENRKAEEVLDELILKENINIFDSYILQDIYIKKSQLEGTPLSSYIEKYKAYSRTNKSFSKLAKEVVNNIR